MTLIAGTPHFDCRCPNGRVKPFCLVGLTGKHGCCCEDSLCAARASLSATVAQKSCCRCKAYDEAAGDESRTDARLGKAGCQKTLVEGIVAIPAPSVKAPVQDLTAHLFVAAPESTMTQEGFGAGDGLFANHYHWPPPTDLVTVLQRFLI